MKKRDILKSWLIAAEEPGPNILLTAGVHGDEYEPMLVAMDLINDLSGLLKCGSVTIVPITNESAYFNNCRFGEDGLDLARICPGKSSGTVTEKVAAQISELIKKADYFIDMHTGGLAYDIYPLVGYLLHPSPDVLRKQQEMAKAYCFPLIWGTDFRPEGRTLSIARDANIPAIYLEYGGGSGIRKHVVASYKRGFMGILNYLNMLKIEIQDAPHKEEFWIEDYRKNSGYLQAKMPSPIDGIFVPEVNIGDRIKKGQLFGEVVESFSGKRNAVYADKDGVVFLLRTMVGVKSGEALGGIMPVESQDKKVVYE